MMWLVLHSQELASLRTADRVASLGIALGKVQVCHVPSSGRLLAQPLGPSLAPSLRSHPSQASLLTQLLLRKV